MRIFEDCYRLFTSLLPSIPFGFVTWKPLPPPALPYLIMENLTYSGATPKASFPLEETRLPIPKWYVPAFFAVLVVSLALPHGTNRIILTLPVALGLVSMLYNHTDGSFKKDYDLGNLVLGWFLVYLSLILTNPERVFWKRDGRDLTADERFKEAQSKSFWQKLPWSFGVWTNPRGIGWSHEAPGLRRAAPEGYPLWYVPADGVYLKRMHVIAKIVQLTSGNEGNLLRVSL